MKNLMPETALPFFKRVGNQNVKSAQKSPKPLFFKIKIDIITRLDHLPRQVQGIVPEAVDVAGSVR